MYTAKNICIFIFDVFHIREHCSIHNKPFLCGPLAIENDRNLNLNLHSSPKSSHSTHSTSMLSVLRRVATPLRRRVSSLSPEHLVDGLIDGNRAALSRAITLIESTRPSHHEDALALLASAHHRCRAAERESFRIGIAGPPGAGKSTFIEAFGLQLIEAGHRVAVVAVDPSSVTRG